MKIKFDYRNATPGHCDVAVFVNGGLAGILRLRQEEIVGFEQIVRAGTTFFACDSFGPTTGNPDSAGGDLFWRRRRAEESNAK